MPLLTILAWCSLALAVGPVGSAAAAAIDLKQYQWQHRLLLLFAPSVEDPAYQALGRELQEQARGVQDRDLMVFQVLEQGPSLVAGQEISSAAAQALRQRFAVRSGTCTVVLVGKDGGVKLQRTGQVALADIFALIDSMPMRQQERRRQK